MSIGEFAAHPAIPPCAKGIYRWVRIGFVTLNIALVLAKSQFGRFFPLNTLRNALMLSFTRPGKLLLLLILTTVVPSGACDSADFCNLVLSGLMFLRLSE